MKLSLTFICLASSVATAPIPTGAADPASAPSSLTELASDKSPISPQIQNVIDEAILHIQLKGK